MSIQTIGLATLGRDAELRRTPNGEAVTNLSLAFNYGRKDQSGQKPTQWVEGALWGKLAEAIATYLTKGTQVFVALEDTHIETFTKSDGTTNSKLVGRITSIEMARGVRQDGGGQERNLGRPTGPTDQATSNSYAAAKGRAGPATVKTGTGFDSMDDDIPFAVSMLNYEFASPKARRMARYDFS